MDEIEFAKLLLYFFGLFFTQASAYIFGKAMALPLCELHIPRGKALQKIYLILGYASETLFLPILIFGFIILKWWYVVGALLIAAYLGAYIYVKSNFIFSSLLTVILFPIGILLIVICYLI